MPPPRKPPPKPKLAPRPRAPATTSQPATRPQARPHGTKPAAPPRLPAAKVPPADKLARKLAGGRPPAVRKPPVTRAPDVVIATEASYDADQIRNQKTVVSLLESNHVPMLGVMAALCACCGENHWHSTGCDGVTGTHCGLWQLSPTWRAMHDYTDNVYWTRYAIQHGFYNNGGITHIAKTHPTWTPGDVAEACQGAGSAAIPYYNSFQGEARSIWNRYSKAAPSVGQVISDAAKAYQNPLKDAHVTASRIDMGVDYCGTGHYSAIAKGVITRWDPNGWAPYGNYLQYRITEPGPLEGVLIYYAEGVDSKRRPGDTFIAGEWLCNLIPGWHSCTEIGFAATDKGPNTWAADVGGGWSHAQDAADDATRAGIAFSRLVQRTGGIGGEIRGAIIGEWPPWAKDGHIDSGVSQSVPTAALVGGGHGPRESASSAASSYGWPTAMAGEWSALGHGVSAALDRAKGVRDYVAGVTFLKTPKG